jgi:hypothetical protein
MDLSSLTNEANKIFTKIETDPVFKSVAEQAMKELNKATAHAASE